MTLIENTRFQGKIVDNSINSTIKKISKGRGGKEILKQLCNYAIMQSCNHAIMQSCNHAIMQLCNYAFKMSIFFSGI